MTIMLSLSSMAVLVAFVFFIAEQWTVNAFQPPPNYYSRPSCTSMDVLFREDSVPSRIFYCARRRRSEFNYHRVCTNAWTMIDHNNIFRRRTHHHRPSSRRSSSRSRSSSSMILMTSSSSYSIQSLVETGKIDDAIQELRRFTNGNTGTDIPTSTYHALIEACCSSGTASSSKSRGYENRNNKRMNKKKRGEEQKEEEEDVRDRIEIALEILQLMKQNQKVTAHAYEIILLGYTRRGKWESAYRMLLELEEITQQQKLHEESTNNIMTIPNQHHPSGTNNNTTTTLSSERKSISLNIYQAILLSMANSNQYNQVHALLIKMRRQGIRPTVYTYNALLKSVASSTMDYYDSHGGGSGDGGSIRTKRSQQRQQPNQFVKEGLSILSQCQREPGVTPDLITYTTAMKVCARGRQAEKAMELYRVVQDMGELKLDVYFYTTAMDACVKGGQWKRAISILDEMRKTEGIHPNVVTYGVAIAACGMGGQWKMALDLLDQMREEKLRINTITYNSAIAALSKAARSELKIKQGSSGGGGSSSSSGSSSHTTNNADELWRKALHLIQCMERDDVRRDSFTYSSAISTCGAVGRWEEALQLIESMKGEVGIRPNRVAYTSAITACANSRQWDAAYQLFHDMKNDGHTPDLVAYNALIGAGMNSNKPLEVYELWNEIMISDQESSSILPDIVTLTEVITTLDRSPGNTRVHKRFVDKVFSDAVNLGLILKHDSLDTSWEMDLSGMSFPVARAACRFIFRRFVERTRRTSSTSFPSLSRTTTTTTTRVEEDGGVVKEEDVKDLSLITGAGRMREYIREVLRDELVPSIYCVVPKSEQGTLVVKKQVLMNYLDGHETKYVEK